MHDVSRGIDAPFSSNIDTTICSTLSWAIHREPSLLRKFISWEPFAMYQQFSRIYQLRRVYRCLTYLGRTRRTRTENGREALYKMVKGKTLKDRVVCFISVNLNGTSLRDTVTKVSILSFFLSFIWCRRIFVTAVWVENIGSAVVMSRVGDWQCEQGDGVVQFNKIGPQLRYIQ